jgi:predicted nucleotidyltransferase/plasmid stability protein
MSTLTIRGVPDDLHEALKARAERNRRSLNSEILVLLESAAGDRSIGAGTANVDAAYDAAASPGWIVRERAGTTTPPRAEAIKRLLGERRQDLRALGVRRIGLFGSILRGTAHTDSDVDVLVEFQAGHVPGLSFVSMERELSGLLQGRRVDLVTPRFLNGRIREQILREAEPLYVAA